jgi:hypothetical protein
MRTSISSASTTVAREGVLESSATKPTPQASLSFAGLKRPAASGTAECLEKTCAQAEGRERVSGGAAAARDRAE